MITPETWDFPAPPSSLVSHPVSRKNISEFIESQQFNNLVSVTLPDCVQSPEKLKSLLTEDCEYYKVKQLPLTELIKPVFVQSFIKKGKLLALSSFAKFDLEDCFAFSEDGELKLSVQSQTYQTLGLEGKAEFNKTSGTHVITIDVRDESFVPSKKQYDRTLSRFQETKLAFETILSWTPHDERVCPSSIAEYLTRAGYEVELLTPHTRSVHKYNTRVPCLSDNKPAHVLEWLGAVALDCDMEYIDINSSMDMEVPTTSLTWKGLYSSSQILALLESLVEFIQEKSTVPWVSLNVHGFYNSLPCHRDQHYTILVDNQLQYTIYKAKSS